MSETSGQELPDEAVELAHRLFDMARAGDTAGLAPYLDAGLPLNLADPQGNTLLMLAAYHGHAGLTGELGRRGADVNRVNDRGQSPVAGAIFKGEDDVITTLLDLGADLDAGTPSGRQTADYFNRALPR